MKTLAIIGGTGLAEFSNFTELKRHCHLTTELGSPSADVVEGVLGNIRLLFLPRHGSSHSVAPHKINYRANLLVLQKLGADAIISVNAVGGIHPDAVSGHISIPNQIIDYTSGREHTYFDGVFRPLDYVDFTHPYDENLRQRLIGAVGNVLSINSGKLHGGFRSSGFSSKGVYGATQGPRLESIAEINRLERDGCDLVGMTGMPEAALARELSIPYASMCLVVNPAAGKSDKLITIDDVRLVLEDGMEVVKQVVFEVCKSY
jgi:5'-methylthioinosine phosphorylase